MVGTETGYHPDGEVPGCESFSPDSCTADDDCNDQPLANVTRAADSGLRTAARAAALTDKTDRTTIAALIFTCSPQLMIYNIKLPRGSHLRAMGRHIGLKAA